MAVPSYIKEALRKEIEGYNLNSDTEDLIFERVLGTAEATYDFDPNFRANLAGLSPADREKVIREFLREYIKREINFETSNITDQIKRVSDFHFGKGFKLSDINVRKKTENKDGSRNFKPYEDIRSKITEHFLPDESTASEKSFTSEYRKNIDQVAKEFNEGNIDLTTAQNQVNDLTNKFNSGTGVTVFDSEFGDFIDHRMALVKQRVDAAESKGDLFFKTKSEKLRLINELYAGNTSNVDNHVPKYKFKNSKEKNKFKEGLAKTHVEVSIDPDNGKMKVTGDGVYEFHEGSLKRYEDQVPKNYEGAYSTLVQGNLVTSVTDLSYISETTTDLGLKARANAAKENISIVNDLLNINNARIAPVVSGSGAVAVASAVDRVSDAILADKVSFKNDNERNDILNSLQITNGSIAVTDFEKRVNYVESKGGASFSTPAQKTAFINSLGTGNLSISDIQEKVRQAEARGEISFRSDAERKAFINSFKETSKDSLNRFIQPSISGNGTFANWVDQINNEILDIGGAASNTSLASRAINFFNNHNKLNRAKLNNFIYMAQMVTDPGYAVSEIKKNFKADIKKYLGFDTEATLKSYFENSRKKSLANFVGFINSTLYKNSNKNLNVEDLENLKAINGDFKGYFKKWAKKKLTDKLTKFFETSAFLKKYGLNFKFNKDILEGFSWKLIGQSKYGRIAKLAFNKFIGKYSAYFGKVLKLGINKIPYLGPVISKLSAKYFPSRYLGRTANGLITAFTEAGGKIGTGGGLINRAARVVLIGCGVWVALFVILVLSIMFVVLGALSSNSNTPYLPGSYSDVTFGTFESFDQNLAFKGGRITTSGNVCISPSSGNVYPADRVNWNNLMLSDFVDTDNSNNCRIMCNARKIMGGLQPGKDGALNCNYNFPDLYNHDTPGSFHNTQFWCTQLIMKSYRDDDPGIDNANNALVITMDSYLRNNSDKYDRVDLATPNDPNNLATLTDYNALCVDRENFQPGNIVIMRNNTCNDTGGGRYKTYTGNGQLVETSSAHVEMVLKLTGNSLITISTNNLLKKLTYTVSSTGCSDGKVKIVSQTKGYVSGVLTPMYLCRMFQKKEAGNYTCDSRCDIPANNYPDSR